MTTPNTKPDMPEEIAVDNDYPITRDNRFSEKVKDHRTRYVRPDLSPQTAPAGWYCARCQRGVDPSEVTYNECHEACGRCITNDELPPQNSAVAILETVGDDEDPLFLFDCIVASWVKISGPLPENIGRWTKTIRARLQSPQQGGVPIRTVETLFGMAVVIDPSIPDDEIHVKHKGKLIGKFTDQIDRLERAAEDTGV